MNISDPSLLATHVPLISALSPSFSDVRRIAVLRGGGLGDVLFAVPAIHALAAAYPDAEISLLGSFVARDLLADRAGAPHCVVVMPEVPGVTVAHEASINRRQLQSFVAQQHDEQYDLAVQVHGGGRYSNPLLLSLGARHTIGTRTPDAEPLERNLDYVYFQHEMLRALEVVALAGARPVSLEPSLPLTAAEQTTGTSICHGTRRLVAVHPGATDPRRRWPVSRFARVCLGLVREGIRVLLVGGKNDMGRCNEIFDRVTSGIDSSRLELITNISGQLTLSDLTGVLAMSDLMLGNDSGPRHLAQAVGTPTVSIYWFGNMINAGPLGRAHHRAHLSWTTHCAICGRDCTQPGWTADRCEHDDSIVADVAAGPVFDDVLTLLAAASRGKGVGQRAAVVPAEGV